MDVGDRQDKHNFDLIFKGGHNINLDVNFQTGEVICHDKRGLKTLSFDELVEFKQNLSDVSNLINNKNFWSGKITAITLTGNTKVIAMQIKDAVDHIVTQKNILDRGFTLMKGGIGEQRLETVNSSVVHLIDDLDHIIHGQAHMEGIHNREQDYTKQLSYTFDGKAKSDANSATFKFGSVGLDAHRYFEKDNLVLKFKNFKISSRPKIKDLTGEALVRERTLDFFDKVYKIAYGPDEGKKKMDAFEDALKKAKGEDGYATCLKNEIMSLTKFTHPGDKTACLLIYATLDQRINLDLGGIFMPQFLQLLPSIHIENELGNLSANIQDCEKLLTYQALPNGHIEVNRTASFDIGFDNDTGGVSKGQGYWERQEKEYRPLASFESSIKLEIDPQSGTCVKVETAKQIVQYPTDQSRLAAEALSTKLGKSANDFNLPELGQIPIVETHPRPKLQDMLKPKSPTDTEE